MTDTTLLTNTAGRKRQRPRVVRFEEQVDICETEGLETYSRAEKKATWYTRSEMRNMRINVQSAALLLEHRPEVLDERVISKRGLEALTYDGSRKRQQHKMQALKVVAQRRSPRTDQDTQDLAQAFSIACTTSKLCAYLVGVSDELEASRIRSEPFTEVHTTPITKKTPTATPLPRTTLPVSKKISSLGRPPKAIRINTMSSYRVLSRAA